MDFKQQKAQQLVSAQTDLDFALFCCVTPGGLVSTEARLKLWPQLLRTKARPDWDANISPNKDTDVIRRDIDRSCYSLDIHKSLSEEARDSKREALFDIVNAIISESKHLHYFQGFHTLCTIFLEVGGKHGGFELSRQCAHKVIAESMGPGFEQGVIPQLNAIYSLLETVDVFLAFHVKDLYTFDGEVTTPAFAISWVLTWFIHSLENFADVCRIVDFVLGTHPLAPVYMSAAFLLQHKHQVLQCTNMPELHMLTNDLSAAVDVERLCQGAFRLMQRTPPRQLLSILEVQFTGK